MVILDIVEFRVWPVELDKKGECGGVGDGFLPKDLDFYAY